MTPFFLVHHALAGGDSSFVERFFGDVQHTVYERLGYREAFSGVLAGAQEPAPGREGRANPEALLAPVMVALYSDAYFTDSQCLLEWSLFRERVRWHHHFTGRSSPGLIGVRWSVRSQPMPAPIAELEPLAGDFGEGYATAGALRLIRTGSATARYQRLVHRVAELIVRSRGDDLPALSVRDVELVRRSGRSDWVTAFDSPPGRAAAGTGVLTAPAPVPASAPASAPAPVTAGPSRTSVSVPVSVSVRRWRMVDPEHTRRPILRRLGAAERVDEDD